MHAQAAPDSTDQQAELEEIQRQLASEYEPIRMQGVLRLKEWPTLTAEAVAALQVVSEDPDRSVRTAARDVLKSAGHDVGSRQQAREEEARVESRGAAFLTLISLGSAGTGLIATALSFVSYYTLGRFPFPDPLAVLFWMNAVLTFPFLLVAVLVLFPGRGPRLIAGAWAVISLVGALACMMLAQELFMQQWSFQFTVEKQQAYVAFLSPFRVAFMLLPVILGQSMMLYYVSVRRFGAQPASAPSTIGAAAVDSR